MSIPPTSSSHPLDVQLIRDRALGEESVKIVGNTVTIHANLSSTPQRLAELVNALEHPDISASVETVPSANPEPRTAEHDFRGPPLSPMEFLKELRRVVNLAKGSSKWDELPWSVRYGLNGLESSYDQLLRYLEKHGMQGVREISNDAPPR